MDKTMFQVAIWVVAALFLVLFLVRRSARRKNLAE
jgi:hypothetical protein